MDKEQETQLFEEAIAYFGDTSQKIMVIEEMSELIKELCKDLRERGNVENIAEEVADVEITLAQIKKIYDIEDAVTKQRDFKLNRFKNRIIELKKTGGK